MFAVVGRLRLKRARRRVGEPRRFERRGDLVRVGIVVRHIAQRVDRTKRESARRDNNERPAFSSARPSETPERFRTRSVYVSPPMTAVTPGSSGVSAQEAAQSPMNTGSDAAKNLRDRAILNPHRAVELLVIVADVGVRVAVYVALDRRAPRATVIGMFILPSALRRLSLSADCLGCSPLRVRLFVRSRRVRRLGGRAAGHVDPLRFYGPERLLWRALPSDARLNMGGGGAADLKAFPNPSSNAFAARIIDSAATTPGFGSTTGGVLWARRAARPRWFARSGRERGAGFKHRAYLGR